LKLCYKGFDCISEKIIPDCESRSIYLRHLKTGLEVFHLLNDDEENLFAFAFRTPVNDSTGAAHIMEHSVLCGSEKFPLKEPFVNLMNQSLNTFLNALTFPDKTVYPAASVNRTDYFNLMDVYGDAVFFPLLSHETFLQEAYRLEQDNMGTFSFQGIVYNEMKGSYSSFASVASDYILRSLQHGTVYEHDSGGDPLVIPSFTYEQFRKFHHDYYSPSNCMLFLYGNIPTEGQLDFIQEKILDRLEKIYPEQPVSARYPAVNQSFLAGETPEEMKEPVSVCAAGPDSGVKGSYVTLNWRMGNSDNLYEYMECIFIMQVLAGHDGSPVSKALLESHFGDGLIIDAENELRTLTVTLGISGVDKRRSEAVQNCILEVLTHIAEEGALSDDIGAAVLAVDFANREVVRSHGPYSLELMTRALSGWNYGTNPAEMFGYRAAFNKVKECLVSDPQYVQKLVRKLFLENKNRSLVVISPEKSYLPERIQEEKRLIQHLSEQVDTGGIKRSMEKLHAYQQHQETPEESACIPHIRPVDLSPDRLPICTRLMSCKGVDGSEVSFFLNTEPTDGIVYIDVGFPADILLPADYPYLPLFSHCVLNTGWNGKNWAECSTLVSLCMGDLNASLTSQGVPDTVRAHVAVTEAQGKKYIGRDWVFFSAKMPVEKTDEALDLIAEALTTVEFSDTARLRDLTEEFRNMRFQSIIPGGSRFVRSRTVCTRNRPEAINEIWYGISQLYTLGIICSEDTTQLGVHFSSIMRTIRNAGAIVHVTADSDAMEQIQPLFTGFSLQAELHAPCIRPLRTDEEFYRLTELPGTHGLTGDEICELNTQIGFAASSFFCGTETIDQEAADEVLSHWLTSNSLWTHIRTTGGAYGAYAAADAVDKLFTFISYRDPSPERSIAAFVVCLEEAVSARLNTEDVERAVTGCYGELVQPLSPAVRGYLGFKRLLYAVTEDDLRELRGGILSVTADDIRKAAVRLLECTVGRRNAVICNKSEKNSGIIVKLPV
jgi:presequence protease